MLNKAIVEKRIDFYTYKVRIPRYNKSDSSSFASNNDNLYTASVCIVPGIYPCYDINDVVFVMFENDEINKPVIVGKLYRKDDTSESSVDIICNSLEGIDTNNGVTTNFYSVVEDNMDTVDSILNDAKLELDSIGPAAYLSYEYNPTTSGITFYEPFNRLLDENNDSLIDERSRLLID